MEKVSELPVAGVNDVLVENLRELLKDAESGHIRAMSWVTVNRERKAHQGIICEPSLGPQMAGWLSMLSTEFNTYLISTRYVEE